jgi:nucleoside-diphosphate-sugar epimerase
VLVSGGAGFIGSVLVRQLLDLGYSVRVLDDLSTGNATRLPHHPRLSLQVGSVTEADHCKAAVAGATAVLHLAAFSRVLPALEGGPAAAASCQAVNVAGTLLLLEAARAAGVQRFLYAASSTAYGGDDDTAPSLAAHTSAETDVPAPRSPYSVSKHQGELLALMYDATYGLHAAALRIFMAYGSGEPRSGPFSTVVGRFLGAAAAGEPLRIEGDGEQTRDFVHVDDVARAFVLALQAPALPRRAVINVGSGRATSVAQLAQTVASQGAGKGMQHVARRRQDIRHTRAATCAAEELLGFRTRVSLEEGIAHALTG